MLLAYDQRIKDAGCRFQRVYGRIDTEFRDLAAEDGVASKCVKVVAGAGSVKSSAGTYTACTEVMEPFLVEVIRSCMAPISVANVGW